MSTELYFICELGAGKLAVMPKPDQQKLAQDILYYKQQGITKVISLLLDKEVDKLGLNNEAAVCKDHGLGFMRFPIIDMSVPALSELQQFNQQLKQALAQGEHLAVHCHGGRGRAGILAISLMVEHGYDAQTAMQLAQQARGDKMPVNELQTEFVLNYSSLDENR